MAADRVGTNGSGVRGRVSLWRVDPAGVLLPLHSQPNQIQQSWGYIAAKQLGYRANSTQPSYHISAMYIEFENVSTPEDPVAVFPFERDLNTNYYNAMIDSSTRDFIRAPLKLDPTLSISEGSNGYFVEGLDGNQLTFFSQTSGLTGVYGKSFSHTVNSKIYAAALVATPVFNDRTQDVIFARTIFSAAHQVTKEASSQIGITWDVAFE